MVRVVVVVKREGWKVCLAEVKFKLWTKEEEALRVV